MSLTNLPRPKRINLCRAIEIVSCAISLIPDSLGILNVPFTSPFERKKSYKNVVKYFNNKTKFLY